MPGFRRFKTNFKKQTLNQFSSPSDLNTLAIGALNTDQLAYVDENGVVKILATTSDITGAVLLQGTEVTNTSDKVYTINHVETDVTNIPLVSLTVPSSGATLLVSNILNITSTSFDVVLSGIPPEAGYEINWIRAAIIGNLGGGGSLGTQVFSDGIFVNTMELSGGIPTSLVPDTSGAYDLGSSERPFKDLYLTNNSIYLGDDVLSTGVGSLKLNGVDISFNGDASNISYTPAISGSWTPVPDDVAEALDILRVDVDNVSGAAITSLPASSVTFDTSGMCITGDNVQIVIDNLETNLRTDIINVDAALTNFVTNKFDSIGGSNYGSVFYTSDTGALTNISTFTVDTSSSTITTITSGSTATSEVIEYTNVYLEGSLFVTQDTSGNEGIISAEGIISSDTRIDSPGFKVNVIQDSGSSFTPDISQASIFEYTLTSPVCTISIPVNMEVGQSINIIIIQDGSGSRVATFNASYLWPGGVTPTFSSGAGDIDVISVVRANSGYLATVVLDFG